MHLAGSWSRSCVERSGKPDESKHFSKRYFHLSKDRSSRSISCGGWEVFLFAGKLLLYSKVDATAHSPIAHFCRAFANVTTRS